MRYLDDGVTLPLLGPPASASDPLPDTTELGARALDYVMRGQGVFEGLRRSASQLAGLLMLAAAGGRSAQDHPMLALAEQRHAEAGDALAALAPPPEGLHHHHHMARAARALDEALKAARTRLHRAREDAALDSMLLPLRAAYRELEHAAAALPGFRLVDFSDCCCANHRQALRPDKNATI